MLYTWNWYYVVNQLNSSIKFKKLIIIKYYEWLYANKLENLEEMDKPLETQSAKTESRRNRSFEQIPPYVFLLVTISLLLKFIFLGYHLLLRLFHFVCLFGSSLFSLIARKEIEPVIDKQKTPCKQKSRTRWLHWGVLPNTQIIYLSFSNYSKRWKRRQHSQSHSMKPQAPYTKTRQRKKKKKITGQYLWWH